MRVRTGCRFRRTRRPSVAEQMGLAVKDITNEYSRFTTPEKHTLLTLWSVIRSPLMMGGNLPENDPLILAALLEPHGAARLKLSPQPR